MMMESQTKLYRYIYDEDWQRRSLNWLVPPSSNKWIKAFAVDQWFLETVLKSSQQDYTCWNGTRVTIVFYINGCAIAHFTVVTRS